MTALHTDECGFLCLDLPDQSKEFTLHAGGQVRNQADHRMLVWHKDQVKQIPRKDLGNTMQLIRLIPNRIQEINDNTDMSPGFINAMYRVLQRYNGFDEESGTQYSYIPKLSGEKLLQRLDALDLFSQRGGTSILNIEKGWFLVHQHSSQDDTQFYLLADFLALALVYGKPTIHQNILKSFQIQVPTLWYDIVEKLEAIVERLRSFGLIVQLNYQEEQKTSTITTSDYILLAYLRIMLGEQSQVVIIDKVLEIQKEIFIHYAVNPDQKEKRRQLYEVKR